MEIDITTFYKYCVPLDYCASVAEIGRNAGADTWQAALDDSLEYIMLSTCAKREAMRDHLKEYGAWSATDIDRWSIQELNAMLIQEIASAMRNPEGDIRLYKADDKVYYYLGV